ncbi:hypothetical protein IGS59_13420 [Janthinobacterium sp. GW460P]|uniref:hypothetical protein n=1 Tax=unclassified Janthinobacterium TaxID=2610881 RepID=UPI00111C8D67|nr:MULTISPECIES: hypothetical protein [unclassified Janthinobacterium]MCC7703250.1 hypothetical protein [Janthinobacterium sp. GW460P]MCC7708757.1 hypothetical protein [Janthinobacterium sp. GW460W]
MKAIIFCTSFIKDAPSWESRYQRWLDYYENIPIDAVKKIMIDDGSPFLPPADIINTISHSAALAGNSDKNLIIRFDNNLGRQSGADYPGWWRSFLHSVKVANELGVDKIIHIESDAYIMTPRLVKFINEIESGWNVLWSPRYRMPETAIQVICRDQFPILEQFKDSHRDYSFSDIAEKVLPFTTVHKQFKGDRYSDFTKNRWIFRSKKFNKIPIFKHVFFWETIPPDADFVTQGIQRQQFVFRRDEVA